MKNNKNINITSSNKYYCFINRNNNHNNDSDSHYVPVIEVVMIVIVLVAGGGTLFWRRRRRRRRKEHGRSSIKEGRRQQQLNVSRFSSRWSFWYRNDTKKRNKKSPSPAAAVIERKKDFLRRCGNDYGYMHCPSGFIDKWRHKEHPNLIRPILLSEDDNNDDDDEQLSEEGREVYLDYAGSALPTVSQLQRIYTATTRVCGNPHSTGPAASRTLRAIEQSKKRILDHFNAAPGRYSSTTNTTEEVKELHDEHYHPGYEIVFTSGTTQALQIVAERFPSGRSSILVYPQESHTSVIGMRGPFGGIDNFVCKPLEDLLTDIDENKMQTWKEKKEKAGSTFTSSSCSTSCNYDEGEAQQKNTVHHYLVVLPLECNFGGRRLATNATRSTIRKLQKTASNNTNNNNEHQFCTLLDIAKAAATGPVNLKRLNPEFASVSFYKLFGEPTGLGCLFVRRDNITNLLLANSQSSSLRQPYFGGGSVDFVLPTVDFAVSRGTAPETVASSSSVPTTTSSLAVALSNGTIHFRGIISLSAGFDELDRLGGMKSIHRHSVCLAKELVFCLRAVHHDKTNNNSCLPAIELYGAWKDYCASDDTPGNTNSYDDVEDDDNDATPGPTVAFNIRRADGSYVGYNEVSKLASLNRPPIQLRTGCFCNPGACQQSLGLSNDDILRNYSVSGHVCGDQVDVIHGQPTGAIRASFGKDSTWEDLNALVGFIERMYVSNSGMEQSTRCWDDGGSPTKAILSELYLFPIKSCAAQRVRRWTLEETSGKLAFDREFALVDSTGIAMRLQTYPKMAFIHPTINMDSQTMKVSAPDRPELVLSLKDDTNSERQTVVNVCGNRCGGKVWGDHQVSEWFSDFLDCQCFLARYSTTRGYELPLSNRLPSSFPSPRVAFENEQPILLVSEHAVEALNDLLRAGQEKQTPLISTRHFRPNMVVRLAGRLPITLKQNVEDGWKSVQVVGGTSRGNNGGLNFDVVGQCARCSMVDVDPSSGMKGRTLRTLADYRRKNGQINFGIFLRASSSGNGANTVEEGDVVYCE